MDVHHELDQFKIQRRNTLELIGRIPNFKLEQSIVHPEYNSFNGMIMIRHMLMHDFFHMYRIEDRWLTYK